MKFSNRACTLWAVIIPLTPPDPHLPQQQHNVSEPCTSEPLKRWVCHDAPLSHMMEKVCSFHHHFFLYIYRHGKWRRGWQQVKFDKRVPNSWYLYCIVTPVVGTPSCPEGFPPPRGPHCSSTVGGVQCWMIIQNSSVMIYLKKRQGVMERANFFHQKNFLRAFSTHQTKMII